MTKAGSNRIYWDELAPRYQDETSISTTDYHFGPLLPGNSELQLLPNSVADLDCLEIGSGAGQNSIYLARQGARCTAIDVSAAQLDHGRALADTESVNVEFAVHAMQDLANFDTTYDFIHSTYALPFAEDPKTVIADSATLLRPGGHLLLTTAHPVAAGEWMEIGDEGCGLFLTSYFEPPVDVRFVEDGTNFVRSSAWPLGLTVDWLRDAGLVLDRIVEPQPLPIPTMSTAEIEARVPYHSEIWLDCYEQVAHIPVVAIFAAHRPI
jgi:SAM-dependent methyltransferase